MSCPHCHPLDKPLPKPGMGAWIPMAISAVLAGQAMMISLGLNTTEEPPLYNTSTYWLLHGLLVASAVGSFMLLGWPLVRNFAEALKHGRMTMEALFVVCLLAAFGASVQSSVVGTGGLYYEVVIVVLLIYTFGNTLKERASHEARLILEQARASYAQAWVCQADGSLKSMPLGSVHPSDQVVVKPGELVTVDGVIVEGRAYVSMASLTGEPAPVGVGPGDKVYAGSFSTDGMLVIQVQATQGRAIDAILNKVAGGAPSAYEELADRVVGWFLPLVMLAAIIAGIGWGVFSGWQVGLFNAMSVILIACPCALGVATPLAVQAFLFKLGKFGWRGRSGALVERLSTADTIYFDKTGTLTLSDLVVGECAWGDGLPRTLSVEEVKGLIALSEAPVGHPIARAFATWTPQAGAKLTQLRIAPGEGVSALITYKGIAYSLAIGQHEYVEREAREGCWPFSPKAKRLAWVVINGIREAIVGLDEQPAPTTQRLLESLLARDYTVAVLTGDPTPAITLPEGVTLYSNLTPQQKEALVLEAQKRGARVLYIGDGLNDAPALKAAHVALGLAEGAQLGQAAATAVIGASGLAALPEALRLAKKAHAALDWNLRFAAFYNFIGIALAMAGMLHPVVASILMLSSSGVVAWRAISAVELT